MAGLIEFATAIPVTRGGGVQSVVLTPVPLPGQTFTMGLTSFPPGTSIPLHCHNCIEQVTIVEGTGAVEIDGRIRPVQLFDTTQVAAGEFHRFINDGPAPMRILWVYGSSHVTRTFPDGTTVDQFDDHPQ